MMNNVYQESGREGERRCHNKTEGGMSGEREGERARAGDSMHCGLT